MCSIRVDIDIPEDIIFQILSRLPSKWLVRFQSVCKSWYAVITQDHDFQLNSRNSCCRSWIATTNFGGVVDCGAAGGSVRLLSPQRMLVVTSNPASETVSYMGNPGKILCFNLDDQKLYNIDLIPMELQPNKGSHRYHLRQLNDYNYKYTPMHKIMVYEGIWELQFLDSFV
ncbi:uncharacterized protein [Spinacia oleracea]|uniref:F-box domain-containing protein n=1 Tax=Spinacia oleracea TaxID=3562 RepID=A0ABM3QYQ3_SPIOL|nr:uncharacterized protein LOC130463411 [Spinacia oleracea]